MNWSDIVKFFITVSGFSTIAIYIGKKLIDKTLDAGIENYKLTLNKELEFFKSELNRLNAEHQIKYNKLYESRGDVIKELYNSIYELEKKLKHLTSIYQGPEWITDTERPESVRNHLDTLKDVLEKNRIYFSNDLCEKINGIIKESTGVLKKMQIAKNKERQAGQLTRVGKGSQVTNPTDALDSWIEAGEYVENEIYNARMELVKEFHSIMGVR